MISGDLDFERAVRDEAYLLRARGLLGVEDWRRVEAAAATVCARMQRSLATLEQARLRREPAPFSKLAP